MSTTKLDESGRPTTGTTVRMFCDSKKLVVPTLAGVETSSWGPGEDPQAHSLDPRLGQSLGRKV